MVINFQTSLILIGWIYFIVAIVFTIQLRNNPLKNSIPFWITTFFLVWLGILIFVYEGSIGHIAPFLSTLFFITGGVFLIIGISNYLNHQGSPYFYYGIVASTIIIQILFLFIFPDKIALESIISVVYILLSTYLLWLCLKGLKKEKKVSWLLLMLAGFGTIIFLIIKLLYLMNAPFSQIFSQILQYIYHWYIGMNVFIILGLIILIATYHLRILNDNILLRDTMYGVVGHDLKEPLTHIYSLSNVALSEKLSKEQCKEIMTKIHSISLNANYLARNLLEWAYVSRKGLQPVYKKIDLNQVITSEIELYKIISEQKQITIRFNVNKSLVLDTDENMFRIIIRNLLNNAVKFSTPQSTIIIETNRKGENLEIRIRDKGVGIDAKILEKLNNHAPDHQLIANGMGLYLTKTYVNLLGGDLAFESTKDIGATAILTFRLLV